MMDQQQRLETLSTLLDNQWVIPGTSYKIGLDGLIGLIPGIGDTITTALSAYIWFEAFRLKVPARVHGRIAGNIALDFILGSVPIIGDLIDIGFRSNQRNLRLILPYCEKLGTTNAQSTQNVTQEQAVNA